MIIVCVRQMASVCQFAINRVRPILNYCMCTSSGYLTRVRQLVIEHVCPSDGYYMHASVEYLTCVSVNLLLNAFVRQLNIIHVCQTI